MESLVLPGANDPKWFAPDKGRRPRDSRRLSAFCRSPSLKVSGWAGFSRWVLLFGFPEAFFALLLALPRPLSGCCGSVPRWLLEVAECLRSFVIGFAGA